MQRRPSLQTLERRELLAAQLGPQLISVAANSGENFRLAQQNILREAPTQLTFRFDGGQQLDAETLDAITIERSGGDGSFAEGNEVRITPGFLGFGDSPRVVVARFAETLPDDTYRISIAGFDDTGEGIVGLRNTDGQLFQPLDPIDVTRPEQHVQFRLELGPQVVAVVPQPITGFGETRIQRREQIHVYFNDDPLANPALERINNDPADPNFSTAPVVQPRFYNLFFTGETVENTDDVVFNPIGVEYEPSLNRAILTFEEDLSNFAPDGAGTFRLRIGSAQDLPGPPQPVDVDLQNNVGDAFATAHDLGVLFNANPESILISGEIEPTPDYPVRWPGLDAPGTRDHRRDPQVTGQPDSTPGINVYYYNFAEAYGLDPFGNVLDNAITEAQKRRTREILALYSQHLGVQFIETQNRGLQIVTGDLRALVRPAITGPGEPLHEFRLNDEDPTQGVLVLDSGEDWYDGYGLSPDARPSWFVEALRGIGSLLGLGHTFDQVPGVASGSNSALSNPAMFPLPDGSLPDPFSIEPQFLRTSDIIPGQALHRPEIRDVDIYRFDIEADGRISIETFAQRLDETSTLDTEITLWKFNPDTGSHDKVARNDDFFSNDSYIEVDVAPNADGAPARYYVGITAAGNQDFNPDIEDSGLGGRTQGMYQMRITFQNKNVDTIRDVNGTPLDGNGDGSPGGDFNFWFRTARPKDLAAAGEPRTLFVDKSGDNTPSGGSLSEPFRTINYAFSQAQSGDIVRILPHAGNDGRIGTVGDNLAYEIGRGGPNNAVLSDGETFNVPAGVTVMIDAGTILKLRNAKISVGSSRVDEDRSLGALQVLGTPILVDQDNEIVSGEVVFTSYQDESFGVDTNPLPTTPGPGQWAGIEFRNDFDFSEGRGVWETEGIFLDYVSHADIRYGGGSIAPGQPVVNPIQMLEARPTIIHNTIRFSADAALSADPNSFEETNFHAPTYQRVEAFTSDYQRVGPDLRGNTLVDNSINGLFVRVRTPAVGQRQPMTVSGRFDDTDIVHVISEVLVLQGQPGGPLMLEDRPDVLSVTLSPNPVPAPPTGTLVPDQTIDYRVTFATRDGVESLASEPTRSVTVGAGGNVRLANLPQAPQAFNSRRLYRLDPDSGDYVFVAQLDRNSTSYLDDGSTRGGLLPAVALAETTGERLLPRFDARLSIDPGLVVKMDTARIEAGIGANFYAEGLDGKPIVFTSRLDDEFGAGGTFDTNNDGGSGTPEPGDWGGLVFRQGAKAGLDHAIIRYGGGQSSVSGGFANFNPIEILQADVRVANSTLENNASGATPELDIRDGIGFNGEAAIFIRGAQPVIIDNIIQDNLGPAISVNPDALNHLEVRDRGRGTGRIDLFEEARDNQGPLIAGNRLDNNTINGLLVRNEALTSESVWDDTDIVHVVEGFVYAWNHHQRSGLRLKSDPDQSLVVKFQEGGALVADRYLNDVEDAIGGTIQVIGQPGFPVILTSIDDDSVGAGFTPFGVPLNNTNNAQTTPSAGGWYGIVIRPGANDRNVAYVLENEPAIPEAAAMNAVPDSAQLLGSLAQRETSADENRRLGFNVRGTLSQNGDVDVFKFQANGQTEVYIDIDDTSFGLDTIVELIDSNGNILALSNSSYQEAIDPSLLVNNIGPGAVLPLFKTGQRVVEGPNILDAGMRVILPGNSEVADNEYFVRVRSSNLGPGDTPDKLLDPGAINRGRSRGQYTLSIRLRETDEVAGSMVRLADIRYATNAIDVPASPFDSPLGAEAVERLQVNGLDLDPSGTFTNASAQPIGSLGESHRGVLRVSGFLGNNVADPQSPAAGQDIDVYRVDLFDERRVPEIINQNRFVTAVFDIDYADQLARANTRLSIFDAQGRLILHGLDSNVTDDQGRARRGNDMENLAAGSAGTLDSYIGPVELQEGTYYVAVTSAQMTPQALNQYFNAGATDTNVRMLPIDSVRRLAEDGFDDSIIGVNQHIPLSNTQQRNSSAELPTLVPLFDETSIVPYSLEDVRMFVTLQGGLTGTNQSTLITVDPFTGQMERTVGQFGQPVGDLAMRRDGELFGYSLGPQTGNTTNGNTGNFLNISSIDASVNDIGDDGLVYRRSNQDFNNTENVPADQSGQLVINAMAFQPQGANSGATVGNVPNIPDGERMHVVGNRRDAGRGGEIPAELRTNLMYSMVANTGAATNRDSTNTNLDRNFDGSIPWSDFYGPASQRQEWGIVDVGQFADSDPEASGGNVIGLVQNQGVVIAGLGSPGFFAVTDEGALYSFNRNDTRTPLNPDGSAQFNYNRVINTSFHGTVERHDEHSGSGAPEFASVTLGPRATEGGRYNNVFFATTSDGWLYTFHLDTNGVVEPAPVLVHGRSAVPILTALGGNGTGGRRVTGVAFSIREENPWHQTSDRNTPFAVTGPNASTNLHGVFQPHNQSRIRTSGGSSLYFGFEPTASVADNTLNNDEATGNLAPGGVHGTTISRPFSLEGYASADKPTLYFNYFLETEPGNDFSSFGPDGITNKQVDSFRVFAAGDDGQWQLLATNNSYRSFVNADEFDYFSETGIPVQELHGNTDVWRQARVDLAPLAGNKNVQLRFDFSTAGGMQSQFRLSGYLTEIQAVPGRELVDGSSFTLNSQLVQSNNFSTTFEFVRGTVVNVPSGDALLDGQLVSIETAEAVIDLTLTLTPSGPTDVGFERTDSAGDIAAAIATALTTLDPQLGAFADGAMVRVPEARAISLSPERFAHLVFEVPDDLSTIEDQSVSVSNALGGTTTVTPRTSQRVSFSSGAQEVMVTAENAGSVDGFSIIFTDDLSLGDAAPTVAVSNFQQRVTVRYNSEADTPENRDVDAIVAALDNHPLFAAELIAGDGAVAFSPPASRPIFPAGEFYFDLSEPAENVAQRLASTISARDPRLPASAAGTAVTVLESSARVLAGGFAEVSFNPGISDVELLPGGNVPILYHHGMTDTEVREAIRQALVVGVGVRSPTGVSQATLDNFPGYATNRIRVFEQGLSANNSAVGFSTFLPGDEFGAFGSSAVSNTQTNPRPGRNNSVEGLYIDDIVVGFASRGEMVLNAPAEQRNFVIDPTYRAVRTSDAQQPEFPDETLVGGYTLEVRDGPNYGVPHDYDPIRLGLNEQFSWGRSFDVNERLNPGAVTLVAPSGRELSDGQTFVISNGTRSVTFEFDSDGSVSPGHVRVPFIPVMPGADFDHLTDEPAIVARAIRDAINSSQARNVLGITAAGGDSREVGPMTGNRIELFGEVVHVNPSEGRFMLVDMVAESTPYGRETFRTIPRVDHVDETVQNVFMLDHFTRAATTSFVNNSTGFVVDETMATPIVARATVTQFANGQKDTLVAKGKIGNSVVTGMGNERISSDPLRDVDVVKIFLREGDTIDASVETNRFNRGAPFRTPRVQIFADDADRTELADSLTFNPLNPADPNNPFGFVNPVPRGELAIEAAIDGFEAPQSGYYFVAVSSVARLLGFGDPSELIGQYQLTVRPSGQVASEPVAVEYHLDAGDVNVFRPQGQLIIDSNFISDFSESGVRASYSGDPLSGRDVQSPLQLRPGGAATLRSRNTDRLLPGTVIMNNVITATQGTGIEFAGADPIGGQAPPPVPFGRIVNNTVVGPGSGAGINVVNSSSPTVLNNVVSGFGTGLNIDASSVSTVTNGNAFHNNSTASSRPLGSQSFVIPADVQLFEDIQRRLYIPAAGTPIIDSSFANLNDRSTFFETVKEPVGISASPIIAPLTDAYGIPRVDDPEVTTPGGVGSNVFIDRGAIDRADFIQPTAVLVNPVDFVAGQGVPVPGGDIDPDVSFVRLPLESEPVAFFEIQLLDPSDTGPDVRTINEETVILTENGVTLTPGVDYVFGYSDNSRVIRLTPLAGLWRPDAVYEITLNNKPRFELTLPGGDQVNDGDQYIISDSQGRRSVFEADSGFVLQVPQTRALEVLGPNTFFRNGDVFTITAPDGTSRTFEINLSGAVASGNIAISIAEEGTVAAIRDKIFQVLSDFADELDLAPSILEDGTIQLGVGPDHLLEGAVDGLRFFGQPRGVAVGDQFRYRAAEEELLFEFSDGLAPVGQDAVAIEFLRTDSPDEIAEKIAAVVSQQPLGLSGARGVGDGRVLLGGQPADDVDVEASPLEVVGRAGVTGALTLTVPAGASAADLEGRTFSVSNGDQTTGFVFTTNPSLASPNRRIVLDEVATPEQIAAAMAAEIDTGFVGELTPQVDGLVVHLGEQPAIPPAGAEQLLAAVDPQTSGLLVDGVSGGAIPVPFIPSRQFTPRSMAATFLSAITESPLQVTAFTPGGGTLLLSNVAAIDLRAANGEVTAVGQRIDAITDLAGNPVESNRDNDETRFTIIMPEVEFNFGTAPDSYGTLFESNGARHAIGGLAVPRLGQIVGTTPDGLPHPADSSPPPVSASSPSGSSLFTFSSLPSGGTAIRISDSVTPTSGDSLRIEFAQTSATFELVAPRIAALTGNVAVPLISGEDSPLEIAEKLEAAIGAELVRPGRAVRVTLDADEPVIRVETLDDRDGIAVGQFVTDTDVLTVFLQPGADTVTNDPNDVLGFLNPRDPAGASIAVTVTGSGLLDAWIDFNGDGEFDPSREQVLTNVPVTEGVNILNISVPEDAVEGETWARFRVSTGGNLRPTGVAIGGEVEDYRVQIIGVDLPEPADDYFEVDEDAVLDTNIDTTLPSLIDNDTIPPETFLPVQVIVGQEPEFGTLTIDDPASGRFRYEPLPDFSGIDTFTYRLSTQPNVGAGVPEGISFATVTINVRPVNDPPLAQEHTFRMLESQQHVAAGDPLLVSLMQLPEGVQIESLGFTSDLNDGLQPEVLPAPPSENGDDPPPTFAYRLPAGTHQGTYQIRLLGPAGGLVAQTDEIAWDADADQVHAALVAALDEATFIVEGGQTPPRFGPRSLTITADELLAGALPHFDPQFPVDAPELPWDESNQTMRVIALEANTITIDASNATGPDSQPAVFDTPRGSLQAWFDGDGSLIELLYRPTFHLNRDNVEPIGSGPVLDTFTYTIEDDGLLIDPLDPLGAPIQGTPLTSTATVSIDVLPRNNPPTPVDDLVSVGMVGDNDPNTAWSQFFVQQGLEVPVPTEDVPLLIPADFLLQNDFAGTPGSLDENNAVNDNDGALTIISVEVDHRDASVSLDAEGNIIFIPPRDIYGEVMFTYVVVDQGIDEDLDGNRVVVPLTATGTVTVKLQPVNDPPVAFDRELTFTESPNPGSGPPFVFTREQLIQGDSDLGEFPAVPGDFEEDLPSPFDENEQFLNVVEFTTASGGTVDVSELTGVGTESLILDSDEGGFYELEFVDGIFTVGRFTSAPDYNQRSPFAPFEQLAFRIEDDGRTTRPQSGGTITLPPERSVEAATLTIRVLPSNDAPQFEFLPEVDILERDDELPTTVEEFAFDILPGPPTALDELERQTVFFEIVAGESTVPSGLMTQLPEITPAGDLVLFPAPDAVGTAIYVFDAIDDEPGTVDFESRSTRATVTVNVRPVNDAPRINQQIAGTSQTLNADEAWSVAENGMITFVMKEDNTQAFGVTEPYVIQMNRQVPRPSYDRIGLLDVFTVGPPNEADDTLGGNQTLRLFDFDTTTGLGGTIEVGGFDADGNISELLYTPPKDYNINFGGNDWFTYVVQDDGTTWDLESSTLLPDPLTTTGRVEFVLNPVNDAPQFDLTMTEVTVLEDSGTVSFEEFATNIFAGPPETAFDEIDPVTGQQVEFAVTLVDSGDEVLFAQAPAVSEDGTLTFRAADNAFGSVVLRIQATDDGPDNAIRGDIVSSEVKTFTINIRPINDPPQLNTDDPLVFTLNEDAAIVRPDGTLDFEGTFIPLRGDDELRGLLDIWDVGPPNEAADITPGGNQTLRLTDPIPASTARGGTLTRVFDPLDPTELVGLRYTPRPNFNGTDSFIYGVIDDGVSQDLDGNVFDDPREAFTTVSLEVIPRNDPPQFSGPLSVTVLEDATTTDVVGLTIIEEFVTDIAAGPAGALDELGEIPGIPGQQVSFVVQPLPDNPENLFAEPPAVSSQGTLQFRTVQDANGVAVFTIQAFDDGPHNPPLEVNRTEPRTFTITVTPVNDPPTFEVNFTEVEVTQKVGPFVSNEPYATEISPGPPDEVEAGQTVFFEVTTPEADQGLFQVLPNVTDNGFLRFTPDPFAAGTTVILVEAVDSEGARAEPQPVTITITNVNDPPTAGNLTIDSDEDTLLVIPEQAVLDVAFDPDLAVDPEELLTLTDVASFSQAGAVVSLLPSGDVEYDPREALTLQALRPGDTFVDTFTYRVVDAAGALSNQATVTINVAGINDPPTVNDVFATLELDGPTTIRPLENDFDVDGEIIPSTLRVTLLPAFGSVDVEADGTLIYTPFDGFRGTDTIRYTVEDDLGAVSEEATITIDTNLPPVAVDDIAGTFRDRPIEIDVAANDFDPDGELDLDSIEIVRAPTRGVAIVLGGGIVRYVPASDFVGVDRFEYIIRDDRGRPSNVGEVRIQVVASELQNPQNFFDVNASGQVTPLDALLILNRLSRAAREGLSGQELFDQLLEEEPRRFYDVDGNRRVEPMDALRVINEIARRNRSQGTGEGEGLADDASPGTTAAAPLAATPLADQQRTMPQRDRSQEESPVPSPPPRLAADFAVLDDDDQPLDAIIDTLAGHASEQQQQQRLEAIDQAWTDASGLPAPE